MRGEPAVRGCVRYMLTIEQGDQHIHIEQSPHLDVFFSAKPADSFDRHRRSRAFGENIEAAAALQFRHIEILHSGANFFAPPAERSLHPREFFRGEFIQGGFDFRNRAHVSAF
jgi:hypothetical protein